MARHVRITLAVLTGTLVMAVAITNASANRFSLNGHNFRTVWRSLDYATGGFGATICAVTLEGSFHSNTIKKVEKALIGHVSRASVANLCTGGSATVTTSSLPWKINFDGFTGTLPAIRSIRQLLAGVAFRIAKSVLFTFFCDSTSTEEQPFESETILDASGNIIRTTPDPNTSIPATGVSCPESTGTYGAPAEDGNTTVLGATTRIRLTLI
jgi:hypothetical protein